MLIQILLGSVPPSEVDENTEEISLIREQLDKCEDQLRQLSERYGWPIPSKPSDEPDAKDDDEKAKEQEEEEEKIEPEKNRDDDEEESGADAQVSAQNAQGGEEDDVVAAATAGEGENVEEEDNELSVGEIRAEIDEHTAEQDRLQKDLDEVKIAKKIDFKKISNSRK